MGHNSSQSTKSETKSEKMSELKRITPDTREFEAGGNKYFIQLEGISIGRFMFYEKFVNQATFGTDFNSMFLTMKKIYLAATSGIDVLKALKDIGDLSYNQMTTINDLSEHKYNNGLMLCSLFINRPTEDISEWNERMATEKIDDWKKEGFAMEDFFLLALNSIEGFREAYLNPLVKMETERGEE